MLPPNLRITDIVSEKQMIPPPNEELGPGGAAWLRVHQDFDKAGPNRRGLIATGNFRHLESAGVGLESTERPGKTGLHRERPLNRVQLECSGQTTARVIRPPITATNNR